LRVWSHQFRVWVIPVRIDARLQPVEVRILRCGSGGGGGGHRRRGGACACLAKGVRGSEHTLLRSLQQKRRETFFLCPPVHKTTLFYKNITPPKRTGGGAAPELRARLYAARCPRKTPIRKVLSLSLRARIEIFGSAVTTKCASPAAMAPKPFQDCMKNAQLENAIRSQRGLAHFVAAVLPKHPIRALKLGDRTTLTGVVRPWLAGFRHA
jgi:hypothetical protein